MDYSPPGSSVPWRFSRQEYWSGLPCPPPGDLPKPEIEPRYPASQVDSLPSEPPGKGKNTGVGSLSLLQGIFPTQELNQGLLHCRWILYQQSYQGSPVPLLVFAISANITSILPFDQAQNIWLMLNIFSLMCHIQAKNKSTELSLHII